MYTQGVDIEKIKALKGCGWCTKEIAHEMHMDPDAVSKVMSEYLDTKNSQETMSNKEHSAEPAAEVGRISIVSLTPNQLKDICEKAATIGAKEALKTLEQERKKEFSSRNDRRLRNTKLLLRNYHMLKEHVENSVFGRTQMGESASDILESMMTMYDNEVIIESIKRSATRTAIIVSHIENMFRIYEIFCERSITREIDLRRYYVVWDMYMANPLLSPDEIAMKQKISKRTVYDDVKIATERITSLIFGVDGLNVQ